MGLNRLLLLFILSLTTLISEPIKIAFDYDRPPFIFGKVGAKGIEPDIIKRVFDNLGYTVQPTQIPKFYLGKILSYSKDFNASLVTQEDSKNYHYSDIIIPYEYVVITSKDKDLEINSIKDLTKLQFITYSGAYRELGDEFKTYFNLKDGLYKNNYNETQSYKEAFERFINGEYDALLIEKSIFKWYKKFLKDKNSYNFHPIFNSKYGSKLAFYSKELRDSFNQSLANFRETKEYEQIVKYYKNHDLYPLLKLANLLSDISSKYMYEQKDKRLKNILYPFLNIKDIVSIEITDSRLKSCFIKVYKSYSKDRIDNIDTIITPIYYKLDGATINLGSIKIEYNRDYNFLDGNLIPNISCFGNLKQNDSKEIKRVYKSHHILKSFHTLSLTKKERLWLDKKRVINVYIDTNNYAPYIFCDNDKPNGIIIDYLKLFSSKLGVKLNLIRKEDKKIDNNLIKEQSIDIVINTLNNLNKKDFYLTSYYDTLKMAIFSNDIEFNSINDLNGMRVAVIKDSFIEDYLRKKYPFIKLKSYNSVIECINGVLNDEADALIESYSVVKYIMKKYNSNLNYASLIDNFRVSNRLQLAVAKSEPLLKSALDKTIRATSIKEKEKIKSNWLNFYRDKRLNFTDAQKSYLKKLTALKYCANPNWSPVEFVENGKPKGISIDTLKAVADRLEKPLKYIPTDSWYMSQEYLRLGKCDILPSAAKTKEREKYALFTRAYLHYPIAIVTRKEYPMVTDFSTIANKTMSRKKGSGLSQILRDRYPKLKIIDTKGYVEAFDMVKSKKVYFTVATLPILSEYRNRYGFDGLKIAGYLDLKMDLSIAVNRKKRVLYEIIDRVLADIPEETHKLINDKWTSAPREIKTPDYALLGKIIGIFLIITIAGIFAYLKLYRLNRKIKQLNSTLEERVKVEVAKNIEKDRMMLAQNRLAKMGEMIAMIAHQWRQPLNNLSLLTQSLVFQCRKEKLDKDKVEDFYRKSLELIHQMSETIDDFRNFFKPDRQKKHFVVNDVVNNLYSIMEPLLEREDIHLIIEAKEHIELEGYPNEFGQALLNLINNAKDAIIERDAKIREIRVEAKKDRDKILISIEDYAGGIEPDIVDKICEPYFSTKSDKNGTGLGLYISKMVIEKHMGGILRLVNAEEGVRFEIIFPLED